MEDKLKAPRNFSCGCRNWRYVPQDIIGEPEYGVLIHECEAIKVWQLKGSCHRAYKKLDRTA